MFKTIKRLAILSAAGLSVAWVGSYLFAAFPLLTAAGMLAIGFFGRGWLGRKVAGLLAMADGTDAQLTAEANGDTVVGLSNMGAEFEKGLAAGDPGTTTEAMQTVEIDEEPPPVSGHFRPLSWRQAANGAVLEGYGAVPDCYGSCDHCGNAEGCPHSGR